MKATGEESAPLEIRFCLPVPEMPDGELQASLSRQRQMYFEEGQRLTKLLIRHLPGGLFDALRAAMMLEAASVFRVALVDRPGLKCCSCGAEVEHPVQDLTTTFCTSECEHAWNIEQDDSIDSP